MVGWHHRLDGHESEQALGVGDGPPLLFGLVGISHVPLPSEYFSAFSSCLDCCVWDGLSVFWQFVAPLYCGVSSLWVGLDEWLSNVSWLGKLASVFWWMELDFFS